MPGSPIGWGTDETLELGVEQRMEGLLRDHRPQRVIVTGELLENDVRPLVEPGDQPVGRELVVDGLVARERQHDPGPESRQVIEQPGDRLATGSAGSAMPKPARGSHHRVGRSTGDRPGHGHYPGRPDLPA